MLDSIYNFISGIINSLNNSVESFDEYYDLGEEYVSKNIKNGKIFYDIGAIEKATFKLSLKLLKRGYKSHPIQNFIGTLHQHLLIILKKPFIKQFTDIIIDMRTIYTKYSRYLLGFFIIPTLPVVIYFLNLINHTPNLFFLYFIPVFPIILLFESAVYKFIDKKEKGQTPNILKELTAALSNIQSPISIFLFGTVVLSSLTLLLIFLSNLTVSFSNQYSSNLTMLIGTIFTTVFSITSIVFLMTYLTIFIFQAIFISGIEDNDPIKSLIKSRILLRNNMLYPLASTLFFSIFCLGLTGFAFVYLSDIALQFLLALIIHLSFLFSFSLKRKLLNPQTLDPQTVKSGKLAFISFSLLLLIGIISYIYLSIIILRNYPPMIDSYEAWKFNRELDQNFKAYVNQNNDFIIFYPKEWVSYFWSAKSVTLHFNSSNTSSGNLSVEINIISPEDIDYTRLNLLKPGTVIYDEDTRTTTTKIANLLLDGHEAIKYSVAKPASSGMQYEINYAILKEGLIYRISLITIDKILEQQYSKVYEIMINTFHIIPQK